MNTIYKLTNQDMTTHAGFQWLLGRAYSTSGEGALCAPGWLHAYDDPLVALLMNPLHANIVNPRLFVGGAVGPKLDDSGLKCGYHELVWLERELPAPALTSEQRVRFALGCGLTGAYRWDSAAWVQWARDWLSGKDRSPERAWAAVC